MSFFNALLGAINEGASTFNDEKAFRNTMVKDKATYENAMSNTALNKQKYNFNEQNDPLMLEAQKIANNINQQNFDFNTQKNPLTLRGMEHDNHDKLWRNKDVERRYNAYDSVMANPSIADTLKHAYQMNYATGGKSFNPISNTEKTTKPQIIGDYNAKGKRVGSGVVNADGSVTPIGVPQGIQNVLQEAVTQYAEDNTINDEFDTDANRDLFYQEADKLYQYFLSQGQTPYQAEQSTKNQLMMQIQKDGDIITPNEIVYQPITPNSENLPTISTDEDYLALPKGTKFVDPEGNVRVK